MKPDHGRPLLVRYVRAFGYAFCGIAVAARDRMFRTQLVAGVVVIAVTAYLRATPAEWSILALTIAGVLAAEAMNSAVESVVDLASPDAHALAKRAKDLAAGAVLIASIGAVGVGLRSWVRSCGRASDPLSPVPGGEGWGEGVVTGSRSF